MNTPRNRDGDSRQSIVRNERGAALMIVLVALVGLTALAAAGMVLTETELRASQNQEAGTNAFYVADAGLQQYLGTKVDGDEDRHLHVRGRHSHRTG